MKSIHILLIEDNEGDIMLTTEAFQEGKIANTISIVKDGKLAIDFLNKKHPYENESLPNLILLDINLPKKNGHEVLKYIKQSEALKHIPVIMLTTSSSEKDILDSYREHVNCYVTKPVDVTEFMQAIARIEDFWINIVSLPK